MNIRDLTPWTRGRTADSLDREEFLVPTLHQVMDRMWNDYHAGFQPARVGRNAGLIGRLAPCIDIDNAKNDYRFTAELPGVDPNDVEVTLVDGVLSIKGEIYSETKGDKGQNIRTERTYGAFHRSFSLPSDIDEKNVSATFDKGILTVTVAKQPEARPSVKKIEVRTAA